jgi:23S rRNA (cytosine1962-C5)-methyltransferase
MPKEPKSELNPFAVNHQVQITQAGIRRIRRGHLWIYAGDVAREKVEGNPPLVQLADGAGNVLGYAFYSRQSQIRLRLLSRDVEPPSREFFRNRILHSIARRQIRFKDASACRLVFGEGDLLPGIIVDRYGDYLVLQTLSSGADALKSVLVDILKEIVAPAGILERNDVKARRLEGLDEVCGVLWGNVPDEVIIQEGAARLAVNLIHGQKTGFFLDQSQNRIEAGKYASGQVLDCFTNTGAFALQFAPGCDSVQAVDISQDSLLQARRNSELNGIRNIEFIEANIFDYLREMESAGRAFDLICLDPPAFAKNRKALAGARSGYKEINLRALKLLRPEGVLITSSCSYHMLESDFFDLICEAAQDAHRQIQIIERRSQASDHPILAGMPETHYLKCFFLRAV